MNIREFFGKENKNWKLKIGVILMILCIPFFIAFPPIIAFMEFSNSSKVTLSLISLIIGEVLFWSGGLLVGKELLTKYKSYFNPKNWFKKKNNKTEE